MADGDAVDGIDEQARNALKQTSAYQHAERECDVVMKGGITSGVLYPLAVCELAKTYHLRNVGGTSAGAIAAAAAAAAEYGRDSDRHGAGFAGLAAIPEWSIEPGNMTGVFAPAPSTRALRSLLLAAIAKPARPAQTLLQVIRNAFSARGRFLWIPALPIIVGVVLLWTHQFGPRWDWLRGLGFFVGAMLALVGASGMRKLLGRHGDSSGRSTRSMITSAVLLLGGLAIAVALLAYANAESRVLGSGFGFFLIVVGGLIGCAVAASLAAGRVVADNHYGIVSGHNDEGTSLSDWLSGVINEMAGLDPTGSPLTFGQLRHGPGDRRPAESPDAQPSAEPFVNLEMLTTAVTLGRAIRMPYGFGSRFFYDPDDFARYFPEPVMRYLADYSHPPQNTTSEQKDWDEVVAAARARGLRPLPNADGLPVIIATRMSLSFPVLLSAVRLYAVDRSRPGARQSHEFEPCWFSDGGVTSNFPITFFDSLLPSRPTFGINLRKFPEWRAQSEVERSNLTMPRNNYGGILDWWARIPADATGWSSIFGFLGLIMKSMQNWVDNEQAHVSGFRDRIVTIFHSDSEGGMNLDMPKETLLKLSERGRYAGSRLVEYYTTDGRDQDPKRVVGWDNHRWIRMRNTLAQLEDALIAMADVYPSEYRALVEGDTAELPSYEWTKTQQRFAELLLGGSTPDSDADDNPADASTNPNDAAMQGLIGLGVMLAAERTVAPDGTVVNLLRKGSPTPMPHLVSRPGTD